MIRLDTHAALWLFADRQDELTTGGRRLIERDEIFISPIVELELTVLHEVGRFADDGARIVDGLIESIGAQRSRMALATIVHSAHGLEWTRDPFDRLIVADAVAARCPLLTDDAAIHEHCDLAVW